MHTSRSDTTCHYARYDFKLIGAIEFQAEGYRTLLWNSSLGAPLSYSGKGTCCTTGSDRQTLPLVLMPLSGSCTAACILEKRSDTPEGCKLLTNYSDTYIN